MIDLKSNPAEFETGESGFVRYYAAKFNNIDLVGDRCMPGCFEKSLQRWRDSGDPLPIVFSHSWGNPFDIIGFANPNDCYEDEKGLVIQGRLDVDTNPTALQVFSLMQRRILTESSFSYDIPKGGEKRASDGANNLYVLNLLETGPTLKGANPETAEAVKSALFLNQREYFGITDEDSEAARMRRRNALDSVRHAAGKGTAPRAERLVAEDDDAAFIDNARQCVACGHFLAKPPALIPHGYGYAHRVCSQCGVVSLEASEIKSLRDTFSNADKAIEDETLRIAAAYTKRRLAVRAREEQTVASSKATLERHRRDLAELERFLGKSTVVAALYIEPSGDGRFNVLDESGTVIGRYPTRALAERRLAEHQSGDFDKSVQAEVARLEASVRGGAR